MMSQRPEKKESAPDGILSEFQGSRIADNTPIFDEFMDSLLDQFYRYQNQRDATC